jgi:hypothetical protein
MNCEFREILADDFYTGQSTDFVNYQICSCGFHLWSKRSKRVIKSSTKLYTSFLISGKSGRYRVILKEANAKAKATRNGLLWFLLWFVIVCAFMYHM